MARLRDDGLRLLQERSVLAKLFEVDPAPAIVCTSDVPLLEAAKQFLGLSRGRVIYLLEDGCAERRLRSAGPAVYGEAPGGSSSVSASLRRWSTAVRANSTSRRFDAFNDGWRM